MTISSLLFLLPVVLSTCTERISLQPGFPASTLLPLWAVSFLPLGPPWALWAVQQNPCLHPRDAGSTLYPRLYPEYLHCQYPLVGRIAPG